MCRLGGIELEQDPRILPLTDIWVSLAIIYNCEASVLVHTGDNGGICICDRIFECVQDWSHKVYRVCSVGMGIGLSVGPGKKWLV